MSKRGLILCIGAIGSVLLVCLSLFLLSTRAPQTRLDEFVYGPEPVNADLMTRARRMFIPDVGHPMALNPMRATFATTVQAALSEDLHLSLSGVQLLERKWPNDPEAIAALVRVVHESKLSETRYTAAIVLTNVCRNAHDCSPDVPKTLVRVLEDSDIRLRMCVYMAICDMQCKKGVFLPLLNEAMSTKRSFRETEKALDVLGTRLEEVR